LMFVVEYCELITNPEKSHRLWCVVACDTETSKMRSCHTLGRSAEKKYTYGHDVTTKSINNCTPLHKSTVASTARRKTSTSFRNLRAGRQALAGMKVTLDGQRYCAIICCVGQMKV
jgi:uncharacterized lipoprotein YehR (DUF1307 family)